MSSTLDKWLVNGGKIGVIAGTLGQVTAKVCDANGYLFAAGLATACAASAGLYGDHLQKKALAAKLVSEKERACQAVVRFLAQECFVGRDPAQAGEATEVPDYRVTCLCPNGEGTHVAPTWRAYQGERVEKAISEVRFEKGDPLAGTAWAAARSERVQMRNNFRTLAEFQNVHSDWMAHWAGAKVPLSVVSKMGADRRRTFSYIQHVRSILCVRMHLGDYEVVISIDSTRSDAFQPHAQQLCGSISETLRLAEMVGQSTIASLD